MRLYLSVITPPVIEDILHEIRENLDLGYLTTMDFKAEEVVWVTERER